MSYYQVGNNIVSKLRIRGYNISVKWKRNWITFYIDNEFLFCTDLTLLPENDVYEIILELLKEKSNVYISAKNKNSE